jgi:sulfatase maturation enzyme AslB (radical SAM superfamily)
MRKAAYLQVTRSCNNECVFCSNPQFEKEYSLDEAKQQAASFKREGVTELLVTGGEPTTVAWLPEIIRHIRNLGMNPKIITNAVRLAESELVQRLKEAGLTDLNISIHTSDPVIAERLSRRPGHHEKSLKGTRNCIDAGLSVSLNCTLNSQNCTRLSRDISDLTERFPEIMHFVFNNLDPGKSDGSNLSRAGENPWVIARFTDIELELWKTANLLRDKGKSFRVERVPLCFMTGFQELSTETRKIVKDEMYICSFLESGGNKVRRVTPAMLRTKAECCKACLLYGICAGIQKEYIQLYGEGEISPVFNNPEIVIRGVING